MAIGIDTSKAFRFPDEVARLVTAIVERTRDEDETMWLEWKEYLDLASEAAFQHLPHTILAFANREPAVAEHWSEGYAYLVIGAEPGNLHGVQPIDPGDLTARLRAYIGDAIGWHPLYVQLNEVTVLVIAVDPPRAGDRIHPLHKQLRNFAPGTVFTRRPGTNVQASPDMLAMLERRSHPIAKGIELRLVSERPALEATADATAEIEAWTAREQARLARPHPEEAGSAPGRLPLGFASAFDKSVLNAGVALNAIGYTPDRRTEQQYDEELTAYIAAGRQALSRQLGYLQARHDPSALLLTLVNDTDRMFTAVEVEVLVRNARAPRDVADRPQLPKAPRAWKEPSPPSWTESLIATYPSLGRIHPVLPSTPRPSVNVSTQGPDLHLRFTPLDARPGAHIRLKAVQVIPRDQEGSIEISWTATATNSDGRKLGTITLAITPSTLSLNRLSPSD